MEYICATLEGMAESEKNFRVHARSKPGAPGTRADFLVVRVHLMGDMVCTPCSFEWARGRAVKSAVHNISWISNPKVVGSNPTRGTFGKVPITTSSGRPKPCEGIWVVSKGS